MQFSSHDCIYIQAQDFLMVALASAISMVYRLSQHSHVKGCCLKKQMYKEWTMKAPAVLSFLCFLEGSSLSWLSWMSKSSSDLPNLKLLPSLKPPPGMRNHLSLRNSWVRPDGVDNSLFCWPVAGSRPAWQPARFSVFLPPGERARGCAG